MATEKILIFDEAGNAKRMKVRIARFLDNEPVTASDKENIRTTLNVDGSQSGTFTTPLSVTSASDSSFTGGGNVTVSGGVTTLNNSGDNALRVESTNGNPMYVNVVGAAQNYLFDVRDDGKRVRLSSTLRALERLELRLAVRSGLSTPRAT
ncbi:MAG: hypothetical protein EBT12_00855 [Marivivens sp.]|nr:hypothetical protein [Marivivens sp.]